MHLVLLSGGSGKRLWPLSNDARSKQFLKVLENENSQLQSMTQRVWVQLNRVQLADSTIIATSKSQVDMIQSQVGRQVELIVEPSRRDTFPAIALAASYLYSVKGAALDEIMTVLPVDPFVQDNFFESVKDLEELIQEKTVDLALMGVKPTYPSSKYGYIVPKENSEDKYQQVSHFIEKPTEEKAVELIEQGAMWNCGVFAFRLNYIIELMEAKGIPVNYDELLSQYEKLSKISFDYEVVENTENIGVLQYEGFWKDLGTWNTLTEEMSSHQIGKGIISEDSVNTHLINELELPIVVIGAPNLLVAASPDGILVTEKSHSPRIKEYIGPFENRPMYEERRWGWYRVLDYTKTEEGQEVLTKRIGIHAGLNLSYQFHMQRSEVWTIIKGEGIFVQNDRLSVVRPGDVLKINVGDKHGLKAVTNLEMIEVQSGSQLIEEDIVRIFMSWEEVEEHCYALNN